MPFMTFTDGSVLTAAQVNDYLMRQAISRVTSATRPGTPTDGQVIYETDTALFMRYNATAAAWEFLAVGDPQKQRGFVASPTTAAGGTEQAVFRWPAVQLAANRLYSLEIAGLGLVSSVTNIEYLLRWRYTEDGSVPTTTSNILGASRDRIAPSGGDGPIVHWTTFYTSPGTAPNFSALLTLVRFNGASGTITPTPTSGGMHLILTDRGPAKTATGITF